MCSVISLQLSKRRERRNPSFLLFSFFESNQLYSSALGLLSFTNHIYKQTENVDGIFSSLNSTLLQSRLTIDNNSSEWMSELSGNLWWLIHHGSIQKDGRDRWTVFSDTIWLGDLSCVQMIIKSFLLLSTGWDCLVVSIHKKNLPSCTLLFSIILVIFFMAALKFATYFY